MAAAPEAGEQARHVRPRLVVAPVSPQQAFLERWRPFAEARIVIARGNEYVVRPYAVAAALFIVDAALMNMIDVAYGSHANEVMGTVTLYIPDLAVESRQTLELHWYADTGQWSTRTIRPATTGLPPLPWTVLAGRASDELLAGLRFQANEILLDVWARRRLAARVLADTLPQDVLQFELAPFISYTRQKHKRRLSYLRFGRRRHSSQPGILCSSEQVDA